MAKGKANGAAGFPKMKGKSAPGKPNSGGMAYPGVAVKR